MNFLVKKYWTARVREKLKKREVVQKMRFSFTEYAPALEFFITCS